MEPYTIDVRQVEDLQMTSDREGLEKIFERASSAIVNGVSVFLARDKYGEPFETLTTLEDLQRYRSGVFKYL